MRTSITWVVAGLVLLAGTTTARGDDVLAGIDMFQTLGCGSGADPSQIIPGGIPPNFFDPGSDSFTDPIPLTGQPLTTLPPGVVSPVDTIVERQADAILPLTCGPADTIPIEILALSLTTIGCTPITVTYGGGMNPEPWDVDVALSSIFPQQPGSTMTISHDCPEGGAFSSTLLVTPKLVFARQSDNATRVLDVGLAIPLTTVSGGHWQHADPGFGVLTTPGGFLVDKDGDLIAETGPVPGTTNFFPGLRQLPCTCVPPSPGPQPAPTDDIGALIEEKPGGGAQHIVFPPGPCDPPDSDGDGIGDLCDNLPNTPNPDQGDDDDDTVGNPDPADHFQCYEIKPASLPPIPQVTAETQFGPLNQILRFPHRLCAPTTKNEEGVVDPVQHLTGYNTRVSTTVFKRERQNIVNQFGSLLLDVVRAGILLVPTGKNAVPLPPDTIDHFQCFKVKRSHGAPKFVRQTVSITDQFESLIVTLTKPKFLCAPANKNGEDPTAPFHPDHLLCYKVKAAARFQGLDVSLDNQFGPDQATLIHRRELCVPSLKNPPVTTTTTSTTTTSSPTTNAPTTTLTTSTTSTTLYGSPSRAFLTNPGSLLD